MTVKINHLVKPSSISQFCYYWLPPFLLSAGILVLAGDLGSVGKFTLPISILKFLLPTWSVQEIVKLNLQLRKVGHFLAYALLFAAYARAWRWHRHLSPLTATILALAICLLISSGDEMRQAYYMSRTGSPQDVALDMSGALTAAIIFFPLLGRTNQRE